MFKLIFRTMVIIIFLVFLVIGLALWKGGEPFRWIGEGTVIIGKAISNLGDFVDDIVAGGEELKKNYDKVKDVLIPEGNKTNQN